jgi:hypothetical protein
MKPRQIVIDAGSGNQKTRAQTVGLTKILPAVA